MRLIAAAVAALGIACSALAHAYNAGPIDIEHPWSRATKAQAGAGFLKLTNRGKTADRLVSIVSPVASRVEIHTMTLEGGVMQMRELKGGLTLAPGAEAILQPGSTHIMFMGLKGPIEQGADFKAILTFERAGPVEVTFKIEAPGATPAANAHQH
jgi:hypothetical protein